MFKNRNYAFEKSQKYHSCRMDPDFGGRYTNYLTCDYHAAVFIWQEKNKKIMPKKMREKYYDKIVFKKL